MQVASSPRSHVVPLPVTREARGCQHRPQESEGHTRHFEGARPGALTAPWGSHSLSSVISRNCAYTSRMHSPLGLNRNL